MSSVLITRPRAMSEALASTLKSLGYATAIEPLLSIVPLPAPQPPTGTVDAVMITSSNALLALKDRQGEVAGLFDVPCYCVGPRTAEAAQIFGFRRVQYVASDSAELAKVINSACEKKGASILHIAARDVNDTARQALSIHGHRVIDWPVYEAIPTATLSPAICDMFAQRELDAVMIFSPKTARVLSALLTGAALEACCASLAAICLSAAVADDLKFLPWRHLIVSPRPTEEAMITCLQEISPVKP